jgi:hypothetical protein
MKHHAMKKHWGAEVLDGFELLASRSGFFTFGEIITILTREEDEWVMKSVRTS